MQPLDIYLENVINSDFNNNHDLVMDNFDRLKTLGDKGSQIEAAGLIQRNCPASTRDGRKRKRPVQEFWKSCINCGETLEHDAPSCHECAVCQPEIFMDPTPDDCKYKYAFKQNHNPPCAYKRINHFNEKMAQFQGKEKTQIPQKVVEDVKLEISKYKINKEDISPSEIRKILKKLKLSKYYEHVNHITHLVSPYELPYLESSDEDKMRMMFQQIQVPFGRHSPDNRKNFLNYAYIFRKFLELLSLDEFLVNFTELKSREKLYEQDRIWKLICEDLDWEFIPSV